MPSTVPSPGPDRRQRVVRGILLMCVAVSIFALMNASVKYLSADFSSVQLVWARTLGHLVFMLLLFMPRKSLSLWRTQRLGTQLSRSAIQICSTMSFFTAVAFVPLAEAISIAFLAPMIVAVLAVPILGERLKPHLVAAVAVGFVGVLVVMRPGTEVFQWASLLIVLSACLYGTYQVLTRKIAAIDPPETSAVYSAVVGSVLKTIAVPFFWTMPDTAFQVFMLAGLGVLGGSGHYFVARALRAAPANIVSPFQYVQLLGGVILGFLVFGDIPSTWTWLGAAIIVGSGLYIGWSESRPVKSA